jgi:glucan biosynthesis protein
LQARCRASAIKKPGIAPGSDPFVIRQSLSQANKNWDRPGFHLIHSAASSRGVGDWFKKPGLTPLLFVETLPKPTKNRV